MKATWELGTGLKIKADADGITIEDKQAVQAVHGARREKAFLGQ